MSRVGIVGSSHGRFDRFVRKNEHTGEIEDTESFCDLLVEAGIRPSLRFKPMIRVEGACASSSLAL